VGEVIDTEAQRDVPALPRRVAAGEGITILSEGKPVAELGSAQASDEAAREVALERLMARLPSHPMQVIGPWIRDEL
jgi:antitoxin (DNA-binding transcriptional repressor) of toxin-antitoxin stability system